MITARPERAERNVTMRNEIEEGMWPCTVLHGKFGEDDKGSPQVQIHVRIDEATTRDGKSAKGRVVVYEDQVNNKSALYVSRTCRAVGWTGTSLTTLAADVAAWVAKTGGKTTGEIKHVEIKKGKKFEEWQAAGSKPADRPVWDKLNSLGRGAKPLANASPDRLKDADEAMRAAMRDDGYEPPQGAPPPAAEPEGDIPFATVSAVSLGEIARVLR